MRRTTLITSSLVLGLMLAIPTVQGDDAPPESGRKSDPPAKGQGAGRPRENPLELLSEEVHRLNDVMVKDLRRTLAETELAKQQAERELAELRQFIADHHEYGEDFQQYQAVKEITEREVKMRMAEARRQRLEEERAERLARRAEAQQRAGPSRTRSTNATQRYARAGFSSLGLGVYSGRMGFFYNTKGGEETMRVEYDPLIGEYYRPGRRDREIDYSRMTISGSILNAADEVRNIGVAITFFDEHNNQVGSEIVRIENARTNVPYPFTTTIDMALNRAFKSSSTYVLYADRVMGETPAEEDDEG
jgi:hypothetical protein